MSRDQTVLTDGPLSATAGRYGAEVVVVSLAGELDQSNVATARRAVVAAFEAGEEILVIDLSALDFIDSSGIALLVATAEMCGEVTNLRVVPSPALAVSRVLRLTGIESAIHVLPGHAAVTV